MVCNEQEPVMLSGLQHFAFCRRQWALIHVEDQWADNAHTAQGDIFHRRVHDSESAESRGSLFIARGLRVFSRKLNATGICDVVEFQQCPDGISLPGREGTWRVYPVEYKKGEPKPHDADRLQLCGQAMCLEEMLQCEISEGSLFYGETRRREKVLFTPALRSEVEKMLHEMHQYLDRNHTPSAKRTKACSACSMKEICLPTLDKLPSIHTYLQQYITENGE